MNHKQLSNEEFETIVEDLRRDLTAKLAFLNHRVIGSKCPLSHKLWGLEFYIISPLYYRLQKHLKRTQYLDKEGETLLTIPGDDVLHKQ